MAKQKKLRVTMTDRETAWGWLYFVIQLSLLPWALSGLNGLLPKPLDRAWINFLFFFLNFTFLFLIFRDFLRRSLARLGKGFWDCLKAVILGFVGCWLCNWAFSFVIGLLMPGFSNINDGSIAALAGTGFVITAIGTVFLVPMAEELLYRGLVFQGLFNRGRKAAYILSILIFSAVHVVGYIGRYDLLTLAVCFLQYIPAGFFLAWAYAEADSIFAPILIHTVINAMGIYAVR